MTAIVIPNVFLPSTTISSTAMNANFTTVANAIQASLAIDGSVAMTGALKGANGTAALPAFSFNTDPNVGMFRKAADELGFSTNGVLAFFLDAAAKGWFTGAVDVGGALTVAGATTLASTLAMSNAANRATFAESLAQVGAGFGAVTDIASAATTDLGTLPTHDARITGTTTITAFGSSASVNTPYYIVRFAASLTLTHNDVSLGIPGGANYVTTANDVMLLEHIGSGNWRIRAIWPVNPAPSVGCANGLTITNNTGTPTTQIDVVTTGRSILESTAGATISIAAQSLAINAATTGVNALDTGSLANNTWYHIWLISNGSTIAALLSTSATSPTMPAGYVYKYRIGAIRTLGAATFIRVTQKGNRSAYKVVAGSTTPNLPIAISGASGDPTVPTWTSQSISSYVPPTATKVNAILARATGGGTTMIAPNNAYGVFNSTTNPPPLVASGATVNTQAELVLESSNLFYADVTGNGSMLIAGWTDGGVNAS